MPIGEFDAKHRIRQYLYDDALTFDHIVFSQNDSSLCLYATGAFPQPTA